MKIKKINDTEMQIILTEEELFFDYELLIDDLINENKRDEISKVLINIINNASEKCNIETSQGIEIKAQVDSFNNLTLTVKYIPNFNINNIKGIAKHIKSNISNKSIEEQKEYYDKIFKTMQMSDDNIKELYEQIDECDEIYEEENEILYTEEELFYLLECNNLDICISLSKLFKNLVTKSELYKYKEKYYLALNIIPGSDNYIIYTYLEFLCERKNDLFLYILKEHGKIIIENDAIIKLANL